MKNQFMIHVSEQNTVCSVTIMNFTRFRFMKLKIELFFFFRAQAVKRKLEAQREEKRRQNILSKRREEQREATEKFQRSHISSRPSSKTSNSSGKSIFQLTKVHVRL